MKKPIMHMVVPGRRAFGEEWRKVTVAVENDKITVTDNEATEAPPSNQPIFVPGLGNLSMEMADYILEQARHEQKYDVAKPKPSQEEVHKEINRMWLDWIEQKLRWFKGQTVSGPGGWTQRERSNDRHARE